jgi:hypothetical protein
MQVALLIPLLVLASLGVDTLARRARGAAIPDDHYRAFLVAAFLAVVDARLFREAGYVVTVVPLTAALGAMLLASTRRRAPGPVSGLARAWAVTRGIVAAVLLIVTAFATVAFARESDIFAPMTLVRGVRPAFSQMFASPPIDGYQPADQARQYTRQQWNGADIGQKTAVMIRYMHDCTRAGDRVLVTGSTPYQVGYFVERPIAGGHVFWHHEWRADAARAAQSLALLEKQSVPFAFSTHDPLLDDFRKYPRIREYLTAHYVELDGSEGHLLIDTRRTPSSTFGALGFPCFK